MTQTATISNSTLNPMNQKIATIMAYYAYPEPKNPADKLAEIPQRWVSLENIETNIRPAFADPKTGWNWQGSDVSSPENQFTVYVNQDTKEISFNFKGTDNVKNGISDLVNAGAWAYDKIKGKAQIALDALRSNQ
jgi:hypothetical protein